MVTTESVFFHQLEDAGATFRARFITRIRKENGDREWHYFGVTEASRPRATLEPFVPELQTLPFFEHTYVSFPAGIQDLPDDMKEEVYTLAIPAGLNREGVW